LAVVSRGVMTVGLGGHGIDLDEESRELSLSQCSMKRPSSTRQMPIKRMNPNPVGEAAAQTEAATEAAQRVRSRFDIGVNFAATGAPSGHRS